MSSKLVIKISIILVLIGLLSSFVAAQDILNKPPTLSITSMNLNPGTSRSIQSFINDVNGDAVNCDYCINEDCYSRCIIYAPRTPGIYRINITLNDSINVVNQSMSIFVPGEIPKEESKEQKNTTNQTLNKSEVEIIVEEVTPENITCECNCSEELEEKNMKFSDILITILILIIIGLAFWIIEKNSKDKRKLRQEKIEDLGELFGNLDEE